jgi:hypothetical protein
MAEQKLLDKKLQQKDDAAGDTGKNAPRKDAPVCQCQKINGSETSTTGQ